MNKGLKRIFWGLKKNILGVKENGIKKIPFNERECYIQFILYGDFDD